MKIIKEKAEETHLNEVNVLINLDSPHVVSLEETFFNTSQQLVIVTELAYQSLRQTVREVRESPLDEEVILNYFIQICQGLFDMHSRKFIHGDLKPDNILIFLDQTVKLCDLGCAINKNQQKQNQKQFEGTGTRIYWAPEIRQTGATFESEIFTLGLVLHELMYGFLPSQDQIIFRSTVSSLYSNELNQLLLKLLQIDPLRRPTIFELLSDDLLFYHQQKRAFDLAEIQFEYEYSEIQVNWVYYQNKDQYFGQVHKDSQIPHGYGLKIKDNDLKIIGVWVNGLINGPFLVVYDQNKSKEGICIDGVPHGEVLYKEKRQGQIAENFTKQDDDMILAVRDNGKIISASEYKDCLPNGQVLIQHQDQIIFDGQYKNGKAYGKGMQITSNGCRYVGHFENDVKSGFGLYYYSNGNIHAGMWSNNEQNGFGNRRYNEGQIIRGQCINQKFTGQCTLLVLKETPRQSDEILMQINELSLKPIEEQLNPEALSKIFKFESPYHLKFSGDFVKDKFTGLGEMSNDKGEKWVGEFENFKQNGFCSYQKDDVVYFQGYWKDGQFVEETNFQNDYYRR
ncbi:protein kinase domain containing protein [Stylonychia lemnae]|uniref:Protein kinase domain containing protein n=1 Tax=Stylonychia lemnae TaxID=5949 RepID=A0A078AV90_STYLE|nr:protein kinase domain containing protein [Stylonychia lemnae]|eukprot:CDW86305.1 protein kinase domain containing protein [Stylonychia lemnae]